jgi:PqqD family protein of HPr-rel-A system
MESNQEWRLKGQRELSFRVWEDGCVVFHIPTGDTHYLAALAGEVFLRLSNGPASLIQLTTLAVRNGAGLPDSQPVEETVAEMLQELSRRGLIEPT